MRKILILCLGAVLVCSCVPTKKFNSLRADAMRLESELSASKTRADELSTQNDKLSQLIDKMRSDNEKLHSDIRELDAKYKKLLGDGSAEAARMLRQLEESQRELDTRSARVEELENLLKAREQAIESIRKKVADALLGFEDKGLSITTRDGKVYVSMDDKLLFRSGSFSIDPNGAKAVKELGNVLANNPDISIMVEGHTDDVPYRANGHLQDNLDLSVKRATTVTRLLLENKGIAPSRIISAGRGEYLPVALEESAEARAQNRRTEIILSPKLDELMQLMDK